MQTVQWYQTNYPDGPTKVLGFLDYNLLFALQLDHIYTSDYFLGISALLTASLISCSRTQQWPLLKMSKRWSFPSSPKQVFVKGNGAFHTCSASHPPFRTPCCNSWNDAC